jgi:hypothetical protein
MFARNFEMFAAATYQRHCAPVTRCTSERQVFGIMFSGAEVSSTQHIEEV